MITQELQQKIKRSISLLQSVGTGYAGVIEVAYSGGKDSDVILQLAKEAGVNYEAVYKNTTIDPPGTISHVKEMGARIIYPATNFFHLVEKKGFPSRLRRFCCEILKEYKVRQKSVVGVRKAESRSRSMRYNEPTMCRYFGSKKPENHVEQIYPILDWTNEDVLEFVSDRSLTLAPVYYDEDGRIDINRRLGCMCCPLQSHRKRIESFSKYPNMVKAYIRAGQKFLDSHPSAKSNSLYANAYEWFYRDVFLQNSQEWKDLNSGLFGKPSYKDFLENKFMIKFKN